MVIPEPAKSFFAALDLTALNPLELIAGECVNEGLGSYDTRVVASFIGFIAVCLVNWVVFGVRRSLKPAAEYRLRVFSEHMSTFLVLTFVFYPVSLGEGLDSYASSLEPTQHRAPRF